LFVLKQLEKIYPFQLAILSFNDDSADNSLLLCYAKHLQGIN